MASGVATIKEVVSGDTFVLVGCPRGGPPPEKRLNLACVRAPRVAMKSFSHEQQDEPYGFIAREFMRRKLIGQTVEFQVDAAATSAARLARGGSASATDTSNERAVGVIKFNGEDVRCALLKNGLAKLDNYAKAIAGTPEVQELEKCQEQAQQARVGVWNTDAAAAAATVRDIQWALNDAAAVKAFAAAHKNKRVLGLVEYVRDGGCVRISLYVDSQQQQELEQQQQQQQQQVLQLKEPLKVMYASVLLSGIQCDGFKREQQDPAAGGPPKIVAEPFAAEARYFVETRLLNREVEVRVEGADEVGNLYGSLYHPRGNISLLLLQNGLARLDASTVGFTEAAAQMRLAMQEAQQKQLRRWKNWQSSTANVRAKQFTAVVAEVISGDQLLLQLPDGSERRVILSSIRCLRGTAAGAAAAASGPAGAVRGSVTLKDDDSMAFQAKEFVRKKILGKKVRVCVDYVREIPVGGAAASGKQQHMPMQFVSVYLPGGGGGGEAAGGAGAAAKDRSNTNSSEAGAATAAPAAAVPETAEGQNIGALLVQQGLAKTLPHRGDDERAKDYETYLELEKGAQQRRVGLHAPQQQWPTFRIVDLTGPANVQRAQAHFQQLEKIPRLECIVDYVFNASRYKLRIPSQNLYISFALSGVRSPQAGPRGWVGGGAVSPPAGSSSNSLNSSSSNSSSGSTTNGSTDASNTAGGGGGSSRGGGGGSIGARGREAEPFGDEALAYARSRLLQREVKIKIEAIDKGGNFLGTLWASGGGHAATSQAAAAAAANKQQQQQLGIQQLQQQQQQQQGSNFAAELLELGLAHTVDFSLAKTPYKDLLVQAEKKAQNAKLKIWSLPNALMGIDGDAADGAASKDIEVEENIPEVVVSHTERIDCFYIQEPHNKQLEKISQALAQYIDVASATDGAGAADDCFTPGGPPRRGDIVLAKFTSDGTWYRARIEGTEGGSIGKTSYRVMYVDFGNSEALPLDHLRKCPSSLRDIPPQAKLCCLSGLLPPPEMDVEAAAFFESITQDLILCCCVEKIDTQRRRHVILTPQETSGSGKSGVTINEKMLRQGLARLDKKSKTKIFHRLQLEEQAARKAHINVWRYGDCGADDEDDGFAPLNERSRHARRA